MKARSANLPLLMSRQAQFAPLVEALEQNDLAVAEGLWGSASRALTVAATGQLAPPVTLYILAHIDDAEDAQQELQSYATGEVMQFPAWESLPREQEVSDEILAGRISVLKALQMLQLSEGAARETAPLLIVAPIQALLQPVPKPSHLRDNTRIVAVGQEHDPEKLRAWMVERGFSPVDLVSSRGEFSMRGGILDVFPPTATLPHRVEFFGDEIESIRTFDPGTQKSLDDVSELALMFLAPGRASPDTTTSLLGYLPEGALTVWHEPLEIAEMGRSFVARMASPVGIYEYDGLVRQSARLKRLDLWSFTASGGDGTRVTFQVQSVERFSGKVDRVREELSELSLENRIWVFCENEGEQQRLGEVLGELPPERTKQIETTIGPLGAGFRLVDSHLVVVSNHELFQRYRFRRRTAPGAAKARPIDSFLELSKGDLVVHVAHGIARYLGVETLKQDGRVEDYLALEFRDQAKMYVPASHVHLVQKYVGMFKGQAQLSKLGGKAWAQQKERVKEAVQDLALDLLENEAARATRSGHQFPQDSLWVQELEAAFPFQETDDQLAAIAEIKRDMHSPQAMDRLVCGDVGYGKTELAVRAAFKAADAGKQVAVLVPTTILAEQHYRTFSERLADYPVRVDMLSRFLTKGQQRETIAKTRKGQVDILIGTHRLLSQDIEFADLGLLVIDEEQKFGVEHKERLKRFRKTVDILTLTATPIPRTLHMSLLGIRDISSLTTPPLDRRAIRTEVCRWEDERIKQAILRELNRDGQVFFVHNRIYNIQSIAAHLAALVPEARIVWAHGQLPEHELEERMHEFLERRADILVSTTIIESGLDIPTANTMFINMADIFGLAELHQLRGRVGRYKHRGYCYLLLPRDRPVKPEAVKRLKAIEEFSELGSGFQIAMRDLEIRGAGNILGPEQSGHIATVGYEMYCQLLEEAVRRAKGMDVEEAFESIVELGVSAYLPDSYAASDRQRMMVYRMINRARTAELLAEVRKDVEDMLGKLPEPAEYLFDLQEIRLHAQRLRISGIKIVQQDIVFTLDNFRIVGPLFTAAPGKVRIINERTVNLRLRPENASGVRVVVLLKHMLANGVKHLQ